MKVKKIMTKYVEFCHPEDKLTKVVGIMWQYDCGSVPVLNEQNKVMGVITDRDVCVAVATKNRLSSEISVSEVTNGQIFTCSQKDDIKKVLKIMGKNQIRRLPVVDKSCKLQGIISIIDILIAANKKSLQKQVLQTIKAIGKPPLILLEET